MGSRLSEMTLEELWQLFPIFLVEHRECWKDWYDEEYQLLKRVLPSEQVIRIDHIGSTSIKEIWSKPIIDIIVEVSRSCDRNQIKDILLKNQYLCMCENANRIDFNKGYTEDGFAQKVYHLHLRYEGDHDELFFRDYLNDHIEVAKEYEQLKLSLWKQFEHDRDGYTDSKTDFVRKYTQKAKSETVLGVKVLTELKD